MLKLFSRYLSTELIIVLETFLKNNPNQTMSTSQVFQSCHFKSTPTIPLTTHVFSSKVSHPSQRSHLQPFPKFSARMHRSENHKTISFLKPGQIIPPRHIIPFF